MHLLKRISPFFLSFTFFACCLIFQADAFLPSTNAINTSWVIPSVDQVSNGNTYHINHRKAHSILESNFFVFDFKCCLTHHKSLFATQYKQQDNLHLPNTTEHLKTITRSTLYKDDTHIG